MSPPCAPRDSCVCFYTANLVSLDAVSGRIRNLGCWHSSDDLDSLLLSEFFRRHTARTESALSATRSCDGMGPTLWCVIRVAWPKMLICNVARNCSWIGLGLMFETLLLAWQHMLSQRNAYATYRTMFTSYFSMRVPDTPRNSY